MHGNTGGKRELVGGGEVNFAGNGVGFDTAAACADLRAERVFALLFDHDGNVGANFSAGGFG
jgi:hypothetical protein